MHTEAEGLPWVAPLHPWLLPAHGGVSVASTTHGGVSAASTRAGLRLPPRSVRATTDPLACALPRCRLGHGHTRSEQGSSSGVGLHGAAAASSPRASRCFPCAQCPMRGSQVPEGAGGGPRGAGRAGAGENTWCAEPSQVPGCCYTINQSITRFVRRGSWGEPPAVNLPRGYGILPPLNEWGGG